ncbi:MAG: aspartate carbamoyltransferase [Methanosarcinales archaeon]|nr:MAG: aspartate carbamoyltransferase [Methanosarcinales archaeon]
MFTKKHIISMRDFSRAEIDAILKKAEELESFAKGKKSDLLAGKILALLFYESSTRTRLSFETAMKRLGGETVNMISTETSSASKGETLADTIRVVSEYADAIVLRHSKEGSARMAAEISNIPVINAGDGAGHHPTQTLLDLYTIKRESHLENLDIALIGDLKYGRTVHSLAYALSLYGAKISLVSPEQLKMPDEIKGDLRKRGVDVSEATKLEDVIPNADVLYMTRIQKERFPDPSEYQKVAGTYRISAELLKDARDDMIIMHPLPRVNEIDADVDATKHARYFQQAFYGVPVRMAVMSLVLGAR